MADTITALENQIKALSKAINKLSNLQSRSLPGSERQLAGIQQELELKERLLEFSRLEGQALADGTSQQQARIELLTNEIKTAQQKGSLSVEELKIKQDLLGLFERIKNSGTATRKELEDQVRIGKQARDVFQQSARELEVGRDAVSSMGSEFLRVLGVGKDFNDTVLGKMTNSLAYVLTGYDDILDRIGKMRFSLQGIADSAPLQKLGGTVATLSKELFFSQDRLRSEFYSSTGALADFYNEVRSVGEEMRKAGIGMESFYRVAPILASNVATFRTSTAEARKEMIRFVGGLQEAYGAAQQGVSMFKILTDSMGQSAASAAATTRSFADLASALRLNVPQALEDIAATAPSIMMWGNQTNDILKRLMEQSAATGVPMQRLVQIADQFSTFEGAADSVGKLNAILGQTVFSSIDMIYMTQEKRLEHVHGMLRQVGMSFDELEGYQRLALSQTLQFRDVGEAASFFNNSLEANAAKARLAKAEQRDFNEMIKNTQSLMVRLSREMQRLAVDFGPLLSVLRNVVSGLGQLLSAGDGWIGITVLMVAATTRIMSGMMGLAVRVAAVGDAFSVAGSKARLFGSFARTAIGAGLSIGLMAGSEGKGGRVAGAALTGASLGAPFGPHAAGIGAAIGAGAGLIGFSRGGRIPVDTIMSTSAGKPYGVAHAGEQIIPVGGGGPSAAELAGAFESAVRRVRAEEPAPQPINVTVEMDGITFGSAFASAHREAHKGLV